MKPLVGVACADVPGCDPAHHPGERSSEPESGDRDRRKDLRGRKPGYGRGQRRPPFPAAGKVEPCRASVFRYVAHEVPTATRLLDQAV